MQKQTEKFKDDDPDVLSFPRRRESRKEILEVWIPIFMGMTNTKRDTFLPGFILLLGAALILFPGCRCRHEQKPICYFNPAAFNAANALVEAKALAAITPRHSGSPGAQRAAEHLLARLRAMLIQASLDEFEEETPVGKILFRNVIGILPGKDSAGGPAATWIMVGAHYDAKAGISDDFQGANDSGSGVGVLLELARVIKTAQDRNCRIVAGVACPEQGRRVDPGPACAEAASAGRPASTYSAEAKPLGLLRRSKAPGCEGRTAKAGPRPATDISYRRPDVNIMFAFFDGEECVNRYGKNDGLHGSRRLAEQLVKDGRAAKVRAVIILDMVGASDLNITIPRNSALSLVSALFGAAKAEGTREKFTLSSGEILDDHQPFLSAGMPAIDIIDFEYGSAPGKNDYWHTPEDTVDKLSVQSLEIVGRTTLRLCDDLMRVP